MTSGNEPRIGVQAAISHPGSRSRTNEDRYGHSRSCGFVIDGATGLGDRQYMTKSGSDAAWFAQYAADFLLEAADDGCPFANTITDLTTSAGEMFFRASNGSDVPRYAWPSASLIHVGLDGGELVVSGLGDCVAYLRRPGGETEKFSALKNFGKAERRHARRHLQRANGMKGDHLLDDPATLEELREMRTLQNSADGNIWTLGLAPEAANHLAQLRLPADRHTRILLCSDGFGALEDTYGLYLAGSLLDAAIETGLDRMYDVLRELETIVDPHAIRFPRFKRSDDATAMLLTVE